MSSDKERVSSWVESRLRCAIETFLNQYSVENGSNTPDFILANYLLTCLAAFDAAVNERDSWYSIAPRPGWNGPNKPDVKELMEDSMTVQGVVTPGTIAVNKEKS